MVPLRVSDGMQSTAGLFNDLAAQVKAGDSTASNSPSQPSAAAMLTAHAAVEAAATKMAARLQVTGAKIAEASVAYHEQDDKSAAALGEQVV